MNIIILLMAMAVFLMTITSGGIPFLLKSRNPDAYDFPIGEALANGVFLGAGLVHMLSDSAQGFAKLGFDYPWAFVICGATFLLFLLSEHISFFVKEQNRNQSLFIAVSSTIMLSIHSFFAGAALGVIGNLDLSLILFIAILAHKWAASFSLSVYINKTKLKLAYRLGLFMLFSLMLPLGIYFGDLLHHHYFNNDYIQPVFSSIASGTFIYLGTLHGFKKLITQKGCCDLYQYSYVIIGFSLMALVAIWL
jgi:hypothetical protein